MPLATSKNKDTRQYQIEVNYLTTKSKEYMTYGDKPKAIYDKDTGMWVDEYVEEQLAEWITQDMLAYHDIIQDEHPDYIINMQLPTVTSGSDKDTWSKLLKSINKIRGLKLESSGPLNNRLIFANEDANYEDFATKRLKYAKQEGPIDNYNAIIHSVMSDEDIDKMEWIIGGGLTGNQTENNRMLLFQGLPKCGKSQIMDIIQALYGGVIEDGGYSENIKFDALADPNNRFAIAGYLENNPLLLRNDDGNLSKLKDPTLLNQILEGTPLRSDRKNKSMIDIKPNALLIMATNYDVKLDASSGLIRRIIDVYPDRNKYGGLPAAEWKRRMNAIKKFELGAIAYHCEQLYLNDPEKYIDYKAEKLLANSDPLHDFLLEAVADKTNRLNEESFDVKFVYNRYKEEMEKFGSKTDTFQEFKMKIAAYCELYREPSNHKWMGRNFDINRPVRDNEKHIILEPDKLVLDKTESILDEMLKDLPAQYAKENDIPTCAWNKCKTTLKDLDTKKVHYVRVPENHIVIDFDIKNNDGNKCKELNLIEAAKWPKTYAEFSKGGGGVHLHYLYSGDVDMLASSADRPDVEIKVYKGKTALRRKVTYCNDIPVATLADLPYKRKEKRVVNQFELKDEKHLRNLISKALRKEDNVGGTKSEIDWIYKNVEDAYKSGMKYDITDMQPQVMAFAWGSTNHGPECAALVLKMHFKSEEEVSGVEDYTDDKLYFFDCEVFPNLFIICYMAEDETVPHRMINPTENGVYELMQKKLVGFNCRDYDNHMLYARGVLGYSNKELFELSRKLTNPDIDNNEKQAAKFAQAYGLSYADIMEYYNITEKFKSLKKWEVELGIKHVENEYPWDQDLAECHWEEVTDYCCNDVLATKAVFDATKPEFAAKKILARLAGGTVNDKTNKLITKIIFGDDKHPQSEFNYRNLAEPCEDKPYFPGYSYQYDGEKAKKYVSTYRGEEVGEGGYVYAEPGMYSDVALLDVASMHPSSIIAENLFGDEYTNRYKEIKSSRIDIKHRDFESLKTKLDGVISEIIAEDNLGEEDMDSLQHALKIVINSVYGLTAATFDCEFHDPRNIDNIVAKRGALFMIDLKHAVQEQGYTVAHIKTDSIKIPNADDYIINFVMEFGKKYGYTFEHEATYDRMCLVNDAVYIAKYKEKDGKPCDKWTATGAQFQHPYIFKTMFSKEPITFEDVCETKSVSGNAVIRMIKDDKEVFVGKVGKFIPVKAECGGYELYRCSEDKKTGKQKRSSLSGTTGYWFIDALAYPGSDISSIKDKVDYDGYFTDLCDKAYENMSQYGDVIAFCTDPKFHVDVKDI